MLQITHIRESSKTELYTVLVSYNNSSIAMIQKKLSQELHQLLYQINLCHGQAQTENSSHHFKGELFQSKGNFFGSVQRSIFLLKLKITEHIEKILEVSQQEVISDKEALLHRLLRNKLSVLEKETTVILQESILTLYIELNELRQHCENFPISKITEDLLISIIHWMQSLLRQYFVYQEYQIKNQRKQPKEHNACSLKTIPTIDSQESAGQLENKFDQQLMEEIAQIIHEQSLSSLFDKQMRTQQKKMQESLQICRICFQHIKLSNMQKHVNNCAKKNSLKLELQLTNQDIKALEEKLKEKYQESCEEFVHEQIDENFRMICKLVLNPSRNTERKLNRRCSMVGVKSEKNIGQRIQQYIEDYLEEFGQDTLLSELLQKYRERSLIEKKLNNLEMNNLLSLHSFNSDQNKQHPQTYVRRSAKKNHTVFGCRAESSSPKSMFFVSQHPSFEGENSQVLNKDSDIKSSHSSAQEKDDKEDEVQQTFGRLVRKIQTKRSFSKRHEKEVDFDMQWDVDIVKNYSSLHNITVQAQQQIKVKSNISLKDFEILQFLGKGAFGKVYMARRKQTKDIYAIKFIKITEDYSEKELLAIKNQHEIFKKIAGDHLVKAPFAFSENSCHIFVLEFLPGGDLRKLLTDEVYFEEEKAKFYIAEIILAIEHLHKYEIIHRDLKPENLVIDRKGHLKLTDFGLSEFQVNKKLNQSRTEEAHALEEARASKSRKRRAAVYGVHRSKMNLIGTPDYIAPEIINQTSFSNYTIDWWSLGVMAYELIIGTRPFCADTIDEVIDNITNFNIEWPEVGDEEGMITSEAKDFISKLLNKDFTQRLGVYGAEELKNHPFMAGIDWEKVKSSVTVFLPRKMTRISDLMTMEEDKALRKEIEDFMRGDLSGKKVQNLNLSSFIRFDLLKSETIQNMEKKKEQTNKKLKRLKTLKDISNDMKIQKDQ